jgi:predicted nucleic acid-binding protein
MRHDVTFPLYVEVDQIYNLACPAAPIHYQHDPVQTTKTSVHGAINMLGLAKRLQAPRSCRRRPARSTATPRCTRRPRTTGATSTRSASASCYDEGKRCAETLFFDYHRQHALRIKVARIFNTYGPRMHPNDGRVVSNFIVQALQGQSRHHALRRRRQTRSFCYRAGQQQVCRPACRFPAHTGAATCAQAARHRRTMSNGFLLDTNVLSELMRSQPATAVLDWFTQNAQRAMHTSAVTQAEILTGVALLPVGQRRTALATSAEQMFEQDFADRCLPFDTAAAKHYAVLVAARTRQGQPVATEDAQIAAIALAAGLIVVTRNTKDFENIEGLVLANPWLTSTPVAQH